MQETITLSDGRLVTIDTRRLTLRKLRPLRVELNSGSTEIVEDPTVLDKQIAILAAAPITHATLLEVYYNIAGTKKTTQNAEAFDIFCDKMTVAQCQWTPKDGPAVDMTYDEFIDLPFNDVQLIEAAKKKQPNVPGETSEEKASFLTSSTV
jgi:hypothetical protein